MEEKIQKKETEDQKYRGERELERKIVEIHRGEKGEKRKWTAGIGIGVLTEGKRQRGEIERRGRVER